MLQGPQGERGQCIAMKLSAQNKYFTEGLVRLQYLNFNIKPDVLAVTLLSRLEIYTIVTYHHTNGPL